MYPQHVCHLITFHLYIECKTVEGVQCVFPFIYANQTYTGCTNVDNGETEWCSTEVDETGQYVTGQYGECSSNCPSATGGKLIVLLLHHKIDSNFRG